MIYDAVERCYTVTAANFVTDLVALETAKGLAFDTTVNLIKRQNAETFVKNQATLPACGIYAPRAETNAKDQGKRDNRVTVIWDYYAEDTDPVRLCKQAELAAEAILRSMDRVVNSSIGTFAAGEPVGSVLVEMSDGFTEADTTNYWRRVKVTAPLWDRDEGV